MKRQGKKAENEKLKAETKKAKKTTEKLPAEKPDVHGGGKVVGEEEKLPPVGFLTDSCCWDGEPCYCLFCAAVEQISWGTPWLDPAWDTAELVGGGGGAAEDCYDHRSVFSSCDEVVWDDCIWDLKEFNEEDFNSLSSA